MRTAPGAFWASWADALPTSQQHLPRLTGQVVHNLFHKNAPGCLSELQESVSRLDRDLFIDRPGWVMLQRGVQSRPSLIVERVASRLAVLFVFKFRTPFSGDGCLTSRVLQTRPNRDHIPASQVVHGAPTAAEFRVLSLLYRTLVPEGLRLPLLITEASLERGGSLDLRGQHCAACPRYGRLRSGAVPTERTLVCREAGATVRRNAKLWDMNISVPATDERAIEVLVSGLEFNHGAQLAVDITVRSAVTACGGARPNASTVDGAVLVEASRDKEAKCAELCEGDRCQLVVVGVETGERWSLEALSFVEKLAVSRAREAPYALRFSTFLGWRKRWCRMLSVSCSLAFAESLVSSADDQLEGV